MHDDLHRQLLELAEATPGIVRALAEARRACAEGGAVVEKLSKILQQLEGAGMLETQFKGGRLVFQDGEKRWLTKPELDELRQEWEGEFLLDQTRRELRINTEEKQETLRLASGKVHFGLQKVLAFAMKSPGQPFGHRSFEDELGNSSIGSPESLSRYIHDIRDLIGDSARDSKYVHSVSVDRSRSNSESGYVFDDRWHYLVVPTRWSDRK